MLPLTPYYWTVDSRRFLSRIVGICRMTKVDKSQRRYFVDDLEIISSTVRSHGIETGQTWDPYFSHEVVPAWLEEANPHTESDIVRINNSAINAADGMIAHGYDDGSGAFGMLLRTALESTRNIPVLVVAHREETLSKYMLGLEERYEHLTIRMFPDTLDLPWVVGDRLKVNHDRLVGGPHVRRALEDEWGPVALTIKHAMETATAEQMDALSSLLPFTLLELQDRLDDVTPCPDLPVAALMTIMNVLGIDLYLMDLGRQAREQLDPLELEAWRLWAASVHIRFATQVLEAVITERKMPVLGRTPQFLGLPDNWKTFSERWSSGGAS